MSARELAPQHQQLLGDSAISAEVAAERGYRTATRKAELEQLGFARYQRIVPSLVIPIRDAGGRIVNYQTRPDQPRIGDNGRPVKYESPATIPPTLDVPPRAAPALARVLEPLWITEGARKADAAVSAGLACVSLPGVWSWAKRLNGDAREMLPDLQRVKLEERKVIVAFDSDAMTKSSVYTALVALEEYLASQGALAHFCYLPELEPGAKTGLDDFLAAGHTVEQLWGHVEYGLRPAPEPERKRRPALPTATLLGGVERLLRRYVIFPDEHGPVALALYVLHTWALEAFDVTPYIYVTSPQKRSGKTRLEEVLELACRSPLRAASITEAAIFQAVEAFKPTLLIDEIDAIFSSKSERAEALRGILNAGNRRGSRVVRGTQEGAPASFDTFCPKVLAGIDAGKLPDTVRDRSIVVHLERKKRAERVERFRVRDIAARVDELRGRLEDWAAADHEPLADYRCEPLPALSERLEESWEPLLATAELAGGDWPARARAAALALAKGAEDAGEDHSQLLLEALRRIFGEHEVLFTKQLCKELNEDEELPFGAYRKGEGIDGRRLSRMLKPYSIKPKTIELAGENAKGYRRDWFAEAWERYAPERSARAHDTADDASGAVSRQDGSENGCVEPETDLTDSENPSVRYPSGRNPALQSQNSGGPDGLTDLTDEMQPSARAHVPEGRTARGLELEERAAGGADDDVSRFIRGETDELELGDPSASWTPAAADGFLARARETFPSAAELSPTGSSWVARSHPTSSRRRSSAPTRSSACGSGRSTESIGSAPHRRTRRPPATGSRSAWTTGELSLRAGHRGGRGPRGRDARRAASRGPRRPAAAHGGAGGGSHRSEPGVGLRPCRRAGCVSARRGRGGEATPARVRRVQGGDVRELTLGTRRLERPGTRAGAHSEQETEEERQAGCPTPAR
jgi:Protein of unknown function (DUF3631)/Domain of unknown function (DUF3854)